MANRRQVIGAGLALAVAPGVGRSLSWRERTGPVPLTVGRLLVDARFPDAVEMAAHAAAAGGIASELERDVLGLWHDELLPAFADGRVVAFGGVTTDTTLFLMRTLAADHRMRVIYRADHVPLARGVMRHALVGSAWTVSRVAGASDPGDWRQRFGQALGACHAAGRQAKRTVLTPGETADPRRVTLVSWVIAPRSKRHESPDNGASSS
jgi:hypothetical protein